VEKLRVLFLNVSGPGAVLGEEVGWIGHGPEGVALFFAERKRERGDFRFSIA
jgi:hypothetical protein